MAIPIKPLYIVKNKVREFVRLTPKGFRNSVTGLAREANGSAVLKASVTAMPDHGKANTALLRLLAKEWQIPRSSLTIIKGLTKKRKTVEIATDLDTVLPVLETWYRKISRQMHFIEGNG